MAELLASLAAAAAAAVEIGAPAAAATATATTAATSAAAAATATAGTLTSIQGGLSVASSISALASGLLGAHEAHQQSVQSDLASQEQALRIKQDYLKKVGAARVAFAGSGVALGGQDVAVEDSLKDQADFETRISKNNAALNRAQYATKGLMSIVSGVGNAAKAGASTGVDIARRGI